MSYGDWSAAWWQWAVSIPFDANHPFNDQTGANCGAKQENGAAFFLAGTWVGPVERKNCTVPKGKPLFIPILNVECSTVEPAPFHGNDGQELRDCVGHPAFSVKLSSLKVTVDGERVTDLKQYRVQSPMFDFLNIPVDDILFTNETSGSSVSDGYWVMLKPLSPGKHTIHFEGTTVGGVKDGTTLDPFTQNVTYKLTIAP